MTNQQAPPPPFLPPLTPQQVEASNTRVGLYLAKLGVTAFDEGFDIMSGLKKLPKPQRLALYRSKEAQFGSIQTWLTQPNEVPHEGTDQQGAPLPPEPAPSLMELSSLTCAWILKDAATLFAEEDERLRAV